MSGKLRPGRHPSPQAPLPARLRLFEPIFPHPVRAHFADEAACRRYLAESRWPDGLRCPRCRHGKALELPGRLLWRCMACGHDTSVTAGTVRHRTDTPLTQWFCAAYLVTTQTPGLSALELQRQLGIRRYETARTMLHKLRGAVGRPGPEPHARPPPGSRARCLRKKTPSPAPTCSPWGECRRGSAGCQGGGLADSESLVLYVFLRRSRKSASFTTEMPR